MFIALSIVFIVTFLFEIMVTAGIFMNQKHLDHYMPPFIKWYCIIFMAIISVVNLFGLSRLYYTYNELGSVTIDNYIHALFSLSVGLLFLGVLIYHYEFLRPAKRAK